MSTATLTEWPPAACPPPTVLAGDGYFSGWEGLACEETGIAPYVPKPLTPGAKFEGRSSKQDLVYLPDEDAYRYPAGERLNGGSTTSGAGRFLIGAHGTGQCVADPRSDSGMFHSAFRIVWWLEASPSITGQQALSNDAVCVADTGAGLLPIHDRSCCR